MQGELQLTWKNTVMADDLLYLAFNCCNHLRLLNTDSFDECFEERAQEKLHDMRSKVPEGQVDILDTNLLKPTDIYIFSIGNSSFMPKTE